MLENYKDQGVSVERGFRFLKDPLFFAHSLFLKKPERIMALLMIMGLSLMKIRKLQPIAVQNPSQISVHCRYVEASFFLTGSLLVPF